MQGFYQKKSQKNGIKCRKYHISPQQKKERADRTKSRQNTAVRPFLTALFML